MKLLTIDIGTSNAKLGYFLDGDLLEKQKGLNPSEILEYITKYKPDKIIASSVTIPAKELKKVLGNPNNITILSHTTPIPIKNEYGSKETLGTDRLAAVVGAYGLFPGKDCLIIDTGTCITYDYLSKEGVYKGGSISPGMELKFKALNTYTSRLPLLERKEQVELTGDSTNNAILSGVIYGTIAEIREIIRMYRNKLPDLQLVICGGDAIYFSKQLNMEMEVRPDLVLTGLKTIQEYND